MRELCTRLTVRLARLKALPPRVLATLPRIATDVERIGRRTVAIHTYRDTLETGDTLIVVQGFMRSWRFPNCIGAAGIGHMFAEGIMVRLDDTMCDAPDALLWAFR